MFSNRRKGWIGIDLGARAIKMAQVQRVGSHLRLAAARVIPRPAISGDAGSLSSAGDWWAEVCKSASRSGFAGRQAACVVPMGMTDLQSLPLPDGTLAERRTMIAGELESMFAGGAEGRSFDFWDTSMAEDAGQANRENVAVMSLGNEDAAAATSALSHAGLRCHVIDGLPLTLARAVRMVTSAMPAEPVAALDWGYSSVTFCIVQAGRPVFTRQLRDCKFSDLPNCISRTLKLSEEDAQQLLATHGVIDPAGRDDTLRSVQEVVADVVGEPIAGILAEVAKTLSYLKLHRSNLTPERLWLFGGGATVKNIAPYLAAKAGLETAVWRLPGDSAGRRADGGAPLELLGNAVALSALAWAA